MLFGQIVSQLGGGSEYFRLLDRPLEASSLRSRRLFLDISRPKVARAQEEEASQLLARCLLLGTFGEASVSQVFLQEGPTATAVSIRQLRILPELN